MPAKKVIAKKQQTRKPLVFGDELAQRIFIIRGQRVMLDRGLAELYGVATRVLNQAVKRNRYRFPEDFMFQLTLEEARQLQRSRSQIVILNRGRNIKYAPFVFTEHGAVMLASVLNSETAIAASIQVVRAFVRLRSVLAAHKELEERLAELERETGANFKIVYELLASIVKPKSPAARKIGFRS